MSFSPKKKLFGCHIGKLLRLLRVAIDSSQLFFIPLNLFEVTSFDSRLLIFREFKQEIKRWNSLPDQRYIIALTECSCSATDWGHNNSNLITAKWAKDSAIYPNLYLSVKPSHINSPTQTHGEDFFPCRIQTRDSNTRHGSLYYRCFTDWATRPNKDGHVGIIILYRGQWSCGVALEIERIVTHLITASHKISASSF